MSMNIKEWLKRIAWASIIFLSFVANVILVRDLILPSMRIWLKKDIDKTVYPDWSDGERKAMKKLHDYHGTYYAFQGKNGKWYFYRDNQLCELWDPKEEGNESSK